MNQKATPADWPEIIDWSRSDSIHERRSAIIDAQYLFEQFLNSKNIRFIKGQLPTALPLLVEEGYLTEAAEYVRLQCAIEIRNRVIHRGEWDKEEIIKVVSAYSALVLRCRAFKHPEPSKEFTSAAIHEDLVIKENANSQLTGDKTLPPPPNVSYHPSFYIHREQEERRALSCLFHSGVPLIIQGPELFGKRAFVSHLLEKLRQLAPCNFLRFDSIEEGVSLMNFLVAKFSSKGTAQKRRNSSTKLNTQFDELMTEVGQCDFLKDGITVIFIQDIDCLKTEDLKLLNKICELTKNAGEPWSRLRLLLTTSQSPTYLNGYYFNHGFNCIYLEELEVAQIEQLIACHGFEPRSNAVDIVYNSLGGHPYLIRALLYEAVTRKKTIEEVISKSSFIASSITNIAKLMCITSFEMLSDLHSNKIPKHKLVIEEAYKAGFLALVDGNYRPRRFMIADTIAQFFSLCCYTVDIISKDKNETMRLHIPVYERRLIDNDDFEKSFGIELEDWLSFRIQGDDLFIQIVSKKSKSETEIVQSKIKIGYSILEYNEERKIEDNKFHFKSITFDVKYQQGFKA